MVSAPTHPGRTGVAVLDDAALLRSYLDDGDPGAYSELIRRHQIRVFRVLLSMLGNDVDAEQACEEVFVRAAQRIDPNAPPESFGAWVLQLASELSAERAAPRVSRPPPSPRRSPRLALRHAVLDIMDGLPADERTVLVLAELQHDPPDAIAQALGLTRAEVEAKLVSARARFQHAFEERQAAAKPADPPPPPVDDNGVRLTARLADGDILAGRYRIDSVLGEGGMAIIYRAKNVDDGQTVAIKSLHPETAASPPLRARLEREAEALGRLDHPHIVRLIESGTDPDGSVYLVMEFVTGKTLSEELERGAMTMARALELFDQILDALGAMHAAGIVHRDLKPENVKIQRDGAKWTARLLDLGIARIEGSAPDSSKLTAVGIAIGTPAYMPPEQAMGKDVAAPGDLYAATILLFEMLTGRQPFFSHDMTTLLLMQVSTPPPLPSEVDPERQFSSPLEDLVMQGLAKDPAERPQSAADFRAAIRRVPEWTSVGARA